LSATIRNTAFSLASTAKLPFLVVLLLLFAAPVFAQNTKGDRPGAAQGGRRENRFKNTFKKKNKSSKPPKYSSSRASSRGKSRSNAARKPPKAGKASQGNYMRRPAPKPSSTQKAWSGDITHRRIRGKNSSSASRQNVYPQSGRYVNNSPSRRNSQQTVSNKPALARLKRLQSSASPNPGRKKKVTPRSASRSFTARKSINVYANFRRPKKRGEDAQTTDIAGHPLRRKNYETPRPSVSTSSVKPFSGKKRVGDRPYRGPASGSYRSATNTRSRAWTGDIAGRKIRGKNFTSKKRVEGTPILYRGRRQKDRYKDRIYRGSVPGGGNKSATRTGRTGNPVPGRTPGIGASGIGGFSGRIKGRRPLKGGGSVSGRGWNNQGSAILGRQPRETRYGGFQGNVKGRRPLKGGGSVSGKGWNNQGSAILGRQPRVTKYGTFQGNVKRGRPLKGGGSVSGKGWNNQGSAIVGREPRVTKYGTFQGNVKRGRPLKGGGSVSGKGWNNQGSAIVGREPRVTKYGTFQGNVKRGRPLKGGGSVSGKLWNNQEVPLVGRVPSRAATKINGYPGKMKRFSASPGFQDQGEEFTGYIRRPKLRKDYIKNENASEDALLKKRPKPATDQVYGLQIPIRRRKYVQNKNAAEDAMPKLTPTKATQQVGELQVKVRQYKYIHNKSSAEDALKVREPGKAFARSTDYQGNIKMKKYTLFEKNRGLHPDAKFVKLNKNNVDSERDMLTNFKLWWARLFKKEDTQPDHLKDKGHKPRYDKGEAGLWYE
jgi:hypothetical protein